MLKLKDISIAIFIAERDSLKIFEIEKHERN